MKCCSKDGQCIACPVEVRAIYAVAHNLLNLTSGQDFDRLAKKLPERLAELKEAVDALQPIVDAHFGETTLRIKP